jgi:hypothetical protein
MVTKAHCPVKGNLFNFAMLLAEPNILAETGIFCCGAAILSF